MKNYSSEALITHLNEARNSKHETAFTSSRSFPNGNSIKFLK